jgi:hypothetical protein
MEGALPMLSLLQMEFESDRPKRDPERSLVFSFELMEGSRDKSGIPIESESNFSDAGSNGLALNCGDKYDCALDGRTEPSEFGYSRDGSVPALARVLNPPMLEPCICCVCSSDGEVDLCGEIERNCSSGTLRKDCKS